MMQIIIPILCILTPCKVIVNTFRCMHTLRLVKNGVLRWYGMDERTPVEKRTVEAASNGGDSLEHGLRLLARIIARQHLERVQSVLIKEEPAELGEKAVDSNGDLGH